ncbi:hypothetical protein A3F65_01290 [Candidatus Saccharibacteria bacterium RIFCSPHIGHO2_12_FULL_47_16b]|nr:MAG: hypothetical protein A3F65_01290 [Candidatus Saccharibacteria bacterium RIFCSPHIGHO2_12_FULL_47_16b]OGL38664.1 MAG: hypothetical protein A3J32_01325 [Candidatus Saccharibacteria bacterium RIFCSPLOWO2_02_FULL_46_7]
MDFLDPRKRRKHHIRLMVGYALMAIAILLTATVLVYWAYGYSFNTKTGIVENGLLFIDSKPNGAEIYINDKDQNSTTSSRKIIVAGSYNLTLKKEGYLDWQRKLTLTEHSVLRIVYPFLFPKAPKAQAIKSYAISPSIISLSPDRRWLLVLPQNGQTSPAFELFDTSKPTQPPQTVNLPSPALNGAGRPGSSLSVISWASDNNRLLLRHSYDGGLEFILLNRSDPNSSVNLNRLFNISPSDARLFNRKADQVYLHLADGTLYLGEVARASLQALTRRAITYKPLDDGLLLYITDQDATVGQVFARILDDGKTYQLTVLPAGARYIIEAAQFQSHWYYVAASDKSSRISIYKDPLTSVKDPARGKAHPFIALINSNAETVSFSDNSQFIGAQIGNRFAVFDIENQTRFQFNLEAAGQKPLKWMDGHRLIGNIAGNVFVMDFDGQNQHTLVPTASDDIFFDRDYIRLFNLVTAADGKLTVLQMTDLRAGADLPKQ